MSQTENITDLTPEQIARFPEFVDKWTNIGLCTDPANRIEAEKGIIKSYRVAGLKAPKIVWCGSPLSQGLTRAIVKGTDKKIRASIGASVRDSVRNSVRNSVGNSVGNSVWDSVRNSVWNSVWDSVWDSVGNSVGNSVWDSVGNSVRNSVGNSVGNSVWDSVRNSVGNSVWNSVWDSVRNSVRNSVWDSVGNSVRNSVGNSVWDSVGNSVRNSVGNSVGDSVGNSVWDSVGNSVRNSVWDSGFGQHDASWLGFYDFFKTVCSLNRETVKLCGLWQIAKNAGWYLPHEKLCWVSERHNVLKRDERGRLHSKNSIALAYPDGWGIYAFHGVRVPEYVIMQPEKITADDVLQERNTEVARVKLEQLTLPNFINQTKAVVQDHDIDRQGHPRNLLSIDIPRDPDRVIKIVQVTCPSTEREYMLRVPTHIVTCAEAVAWTFGLSPEEYAPMIEV